MPPPRAFTLAEVLITLGIIGVVAALTMPALIQKHRNQVVETRIKKFYSLINQAVKMAEVEYGDKKYWINPNIQGAITDENGNIIEGSSDIEKWFNKYLAPHLNIVKRETLNNGTFLVYFADGSAMKTSSQSESMDWQFFPGNPHKCIENSSSTYLHDVLGTCVFPFLINPGGTATGFKYHTDKGFEPYKYGWSGDYSDLFNNPAYGCNPSSSTNNLFCTALLQYNNWKITDDYPFKVRY